MNRRLDASANSCDSGRWRAPLAITGLVAFATLISAAALAADYDPERECAAQAGVQGASLEECLAPAAGPVTNNPSSNQTDRTDVAQSDPNGPPTERPGEPGGTPDQGGGSDGGGDGDGGEGGGGGDD